MITFTAKTAGTGFTQTSSTTNRTPVAQVVTFTPTVPTDGLTYRATINGTDYDYTVVGTPTIQDIVAALQPLMNAEPNTTCIHDGTKITCTADVAGTPFTFAADVVDITAPTITNITSTKADGSYRAGEVINIGITFSEAVTSTGNVTVTLDTGGKCTFSLTSNTT